MTTRPRQNNRAVHLDTKFRRSDQNTLGQQVFAINGGIVKISLRRTDMFAINQGEFTQFGYSEIAVFQFISLFSSELIRYDVCCCHNQSSLPRYSQQPHRIAADSL